jgi:hypothetical protein
MKGTIAPLALALCIPCAAASQSSFSTDPSYLESALKWPTYFGVSSGEFDDVWQRARTWAATFGKGAFIDGDVEITSTRPSSSANGSLTLRVTSSETFGGFRISVEVIANEGGEGEEAARVAHLLAYYLATGKPIPGELVSR